MNNDEIKAACERFFQNGGSRTQIRTADGYPVSSPHVGRAKALRWALPGEVVWHRSRVRGERRYDWTSTVKKD
jgi:hypothetical protein